MKKEDRQINRRKRKKEDRWKKTNRSDRQIEREEKRAQTKGKDGKKRVQIKGGEIKDDGWMDKRKRNLKNRRKKERFKRERCIENERKKIAYIDKQMVKEKEIKKRAYLDRKRKSILNQKRRKISYLCRYEKNAKKNK